MLELKHIEKTYKTSKGVQTHALKDINLSFPKKGMVFILGKSGSGKSTLLNVIGGLDQADAGEIIIKGKSSKDFSKADYDSYRNTYIGFIFQEFNLMDDYTIEKNIALALQLQQKEDDPSRIEDLLEKLDMKGYAGRYPNELSGGQKQRVAIARALVKEPEILMADEPTGALDSTTGKEIFETLKELSKEKLVIVVSHDKDSAHMYADRIIEFKDGRVDSDSAPEVEIEKEEFHSIRSHLPFKDSFKLGFSCLGHKKVRMVFTIILTSFALLTLALSDTIGNFNGANAQHKAMEEQKEPFAGIRMQYVGPDGEVYRTYYGANMNPISEKKAAELMNDNDAKFARVYDSDTKQVTLHSMGIGSMKQSILEREVGRYYLAEMNSFEDLGIVDVEGSYPVSNDQVAISSYLADIIIKSGIQDKDGNLQHPKDYTELMKSIQIPLENKWLSISGIVKKDLSAYDYLKEFNHEQLSSEDYNDFRLFSAIVNKDCDKLYVKDGFVKSLELPKNNSLTPRMGSINFTEDGHAGTGQIAFPLEAFQYNDGTTVKEATSLAKDEIVLSQSDAISYYATSTNNNNYWDYYSSMNPDEQKKEIAKITKEIVGTTLQLSYQEVYYGPAIFDTSLKVLGVLEETADTNVNIITYVHHELIGEYVNNTYYIGELLTNTDKIDASAFLNKYDINSSYYADTIASKDVANIDNFASFATKVFFWASVAFFFFAAMLMMNFIVVSISYRKKDIGILRAIGARSTDVLKIFVWEGVTLACISYVVTMIALFGLSTFVNAFAKAQIGIMISPIILTLRQPILLMIIVMLVTFLACALPVVKIARQRPIDAIKK